ncbi:hypothetical protein [Rhodococcus sp. RS1C4]|nr:hypothetical protein [Rhodococcus sp. RS1C4]
MKGQTKVRNTIRDLRMHFILGGLIIGGLAASPLIGSGWYHFGPH